MDGSGWECTRAICLPDVNRAVSDGSVIPQSAWLFLVGLRFSSRLSFDVSGAVPVQNAHHTIETVECLDLFTLIYGGE